MGLLRVSADLSVQPVKLNVGVRIGDAWRLAADPVRGGLWLGLFSGGVAHFANGRIDASYSAKDGLGKGAVNDLRVAADGAIWVATNGGLSRIKDGRIATMTGRGGLPCDIVHASVADDAGAIWVYTACGLVRIARRDLDVWAAGLGQGKARPIPTFVLSDIDGVRSYATASTPTPHLTKARDGTLWFKTYDGVTVVDPRHLLINTLPPPVHVEQLVADRTTYDPSSPIRLPPLTRDVQLDYTALSLVAPEKNQFRYRLEGRDRDWQDSSNRRQAFYTDLAPGNYRFRVIASNNSDIWNREGATLAFSVAPAWWQTNWFRVLGAAFLLLMLAAIYKLRMRQLAQIQHRQRELSAELAHANRVATLGQLTASIAHEVSQPLSATIANAHAALRWLKAEPPNAFEAHLALDRIVQEGSRATDIVTRIRGLVKKAPGREGEVYLNDEFRGIIPLTRSEADRHGIELLIELSPDLPVIRGDRVQLQQVLLNLVVNAIEATGNVSSGPRDVVISSEPDGGGGVVVSVRDTGPGLDPEAAARLFEPFYTTKQSGLGMGLSICRSIIEAHGGQLWVTANTPRGAIFQFTLPARRTAGR